MTFFCVFHASLVSTCRRPARKMPSADAGFECTHRDTLFFDVARIIAAKQPKLSFGNVKNLLSHDQGNTFRVITQTLREELKFRSTSKL